MKPKSKTRNNPPATAKHERAGHAYRQAGRKRIVVMGGGTGTYTALTGLKKYPVHLTAIVSMADNGGSTKILREEFGILPPGSVRPAIVALSNAEQALSDLFNFRFENGTGLNGHNFGNLFLTALTKQLGSFEKAIEAAGNVLHIKGEVIPSTLQDCHLFAELENGTVIEGETNIDVPRHNGNLKIRTIWTKPNVKANPKALRAIKEADLIVIGPGDLYSSILPNILVKGMKEALKTSNAKKIYICNIMTKFGETTGFDSGDFVSTIEKYLDKGVLDYVLLNTRKPLASRITKYEKEKAAFVELHEEDFRGSPFKVIKKDVLRKQGLIRHDPEKLAQALLSLL
ncbi:MAG: YvcK family protein [Parcubacteria group bacterium]|nr:YvcK family protein [Parcubacteria group bacterium]